MRSLKLSASLLVALLVVASAPECARAQVFDTTTMTNDFLRMQNLIITQGIAKENIRSAGRSSTGKGSAGRGSTGANTSPRGGKLPPPATGGKGAAAAADATTFRPVADQLVPQELARSVGKTPEERAKYERFFGDLLEAYKTRVRLRNAPMNDVARAASFLISESYYVYHDGKTLSNEQFAALAAQMREAFAGDAKFTSRTDREKQQMYENYALKGAFVGMGYMLTKQKGDTKTLSGLREMAKRQLEDMLGSRVEDIRFTGSGVEYN